MPNPALSSISSVSSIGSSSSSITKTPASSPLVHTPTPPILLSAVKRAFDVTSIDFSGLEDGEVFHTGLTPKTPELHVGKVLCSLSKNVSFSHNNPAFWGFLWGFVSKESWGRPPKPIIKELRMVQFDTRTKATQLRLQ